MQSFFRNILIAAALLPVPLAGTAQNAAAFLSVVPDARSAAMGGAGVALSADVFSALRNAAQLPFSEERFGAGYSYLPWMRDLTPRTALHTAAVYFKPDGKQAVSASFRYFSQYGSERTDEEGNVLGRLEPHDMAFDIGYSRTVAEGLSVALTARYVRSEPGTADVAQTFAVDAGLFYRHAVAASHRVTFGFQAANVGGALDYGAGNRQLPWVLKAGAAAELGFSEAHGLTLTAETEYRLRPSELRAWSVPNTVVSEYSPCEEVTAWGIAVRENTATARPAPAFDGNMSRRTPLTSWPEVHPPCAIRGYSPCYSVGNASFGSVF